MSIQTGALLGSYEVASVLGSGGMGTVYRARDRTLQRQVALKLLSTRHGADALAHLLREARAASALNHPSICTIFEIGEVDGYAFMAMELVDGTTLTELCRGGTLTREAVVRYALQISDALAHAHSRGVVHRDLKAANVMITADGHAKVLDFGLAERLPGREFSDITRSTELLPEIGSVSGTLSYMAPELLQGHPADVRSDIWALGVMLYEAATGDLPFKGRTGFEVTAAILEKPLPPLPPAWGSAFRSVVERCLTKNPTERFQTAIEVRRALETVEQRSTPVTARAFRTAWLEVAAAILTVAALAVQYGPRVFRMDRTSVNTSPPRSVAARRSIAVIGFRNVSGRPEAAWLSTALSQMLTTELAAGDRLRTIPGETIARMRTELALADADSFAKDTLTRIRANLGTDLVGFGSFVLVGDQADAQLRVDLRLQDAVSGETVASIAETGALTNLFELASRLGRRLRQNLAIPETTGNESGTQLRASLPAAPDAARLYAEGLAKLWRFDARGARDLLSTATVIEPPHALAHAALAAALADLGEDAKARDEAKKAFELSDGLSRQDRLWIEGRYRETAAEWERAAEVYKTLFEFYSDNEEYGLRLGEVLISGGKAKEALDTIGRLRRLPQPAGDDPRIDLLESRAAESLSEFAHERSSAQKAIDKAIANGASLVVARSRIAEAWALKNLGQPEKAIAANEEARRLYAAAGDNRGVSRALQQIGATLREQAKFAESADAFNAALSLSRALGNKRQTATALNGLANVSFDQGHFADARRLYEESLALNRQLGDKIAIAQALDNLASALYEQGDVAQSARLDGESLALRREIGERRGIAASLVNMAEVSGDQGNLPAAKQMYGEALTLYREIGNKTMEAYSLAGLGTVFFAEGDLANARKSHEQAQAIREGLGNRTAAAESALALAELSLDEGATAATAHKTVRDALDGFEKEKRSDLSARAYVVLARTLVAGHDPSGARQAIDRAANLAQQSESRGTRLSVEIAAAEIRAAVDPEKNSASAVEALIQETKKSGFVALEFEARLARDQLQIQRGDAAVAHADLQSLESAASVKGYKRVVRRARALNQSAAGSTPKRSGHGRQ